MQFYTIPRIIHEIVDTDLAGPELLIVSVSLYVLIGPAMFYFFVCKAEVFTLLAELSSSFRRKIRAKTRMPGQPNRQMSSTSSSNMRTPDTQSSNVSVFFNDDVNKCQDNPAFAQDDV